MMPRRFGLRARVIVSFGVGALLLSLVLSAVTYSLTSANLIERRTEFAQTTALRNARDLNDRLTPETDRARFGGLLAANVTPDDTAQGLLYNDGWEWVDTLSPGQAAGALRFTQSSLPDELVDAFEDGMPAVMQFDVGDGPFYAVGYPLPNAEANAIYVQATSLQDVTGTLDSLLATLLGASAVTTILGIAFGIYIGTRLFSPVSEVSAAAAQIAEGALDTRLDEVPDPDIGRLVSSFNAMTSALQERIERDSRFASDVSHELRSPLMTLTGSVAVLEKRREEMPERAKVALDLLTADIRRFKILVEDLLEISRFDVGAVELDTEEVLLTDFVARALQAATSGREVPVIHDPGADDLIVDIDKRRIAQVIRNLSENADKYAEGVTQARIGLDPADDGQGGVRIELEDEGPGVPIDERELIFERFARGSEGGRRGSGTGVGLGLSLVVEHLRLHGGTIHVADRVDGLLGARFIVTLPGVVVDE
ncbi:MAG: HAMP domain-containing sensor histidine kinase [Actinomycetota bacterium]